eukprot:TRINITY_DN8233_c0_g6_i2.p1 TRINITY_DN8233_c0_g6~~TRINITY_DN8233_c0_g6_i2.p1  ORF type:complete len:385 (+),score=126.60 TRINITY_DN8233_c0_g6_i2:546-1700(+)
MHPQGALVLLGVLMLGQSVRAIDCSFSATYPRQYIAYKVDKDLVIDGKLDDPAWTAVGWSENFVDISTNITPHLQTNMKIRYDDTFLYVGALLQEPQTWANITHTCHCIDPNEDQVIFHDNDFEIFVDADGSTHYYKEYEMNAANATWDLCLDKTYTDGGYENSTRLFGKAGFDMQPPLHCRTYVNGVINDPATGSSYWSVEVALPLAGEALNKSVDLPPKSGQYWRINFSRVEWAVKIVDGQYQKFPCCQSCPNPGTAVEDNWVWSPQGQVDMHVPERWGFIQFSDDPVNTTKLVKSNEWTVREVAAALYWAQRSFYFANNHTYTSDVTQLYAYAEPNVLDGTCTQLPKIELNEQGYQVYIPSLDNSQIGGITQDRYLTVLHQ